MAAQGYKFYLRVLKVYEFLVKGKILVFHQYLYDKYLIHNSINFQIIFVHLFGRCSRSCELNWRTWIWDDRNCV